ncbi:PREDICTED: putative F-box protein At5g44220 [Camelina sativa]|uniref:F-box protein At5g44220 n=1 Tax=Camelina sativa TaxID=90675 RepID=A0ABM1QE88_CAMSA|nr:PREDICTED: putative F-box protein At5g44220 [Camelina sativa]
MEILKRLPVKTLARFLSVSKLWTSIIRGRVFMKLFLTESSSRPGRLFFTFLREDDCFTFSWLQSQNPGEASYLFTHPACEYSINSSSVHGLFCYGTASASALVVYNPTTRRSITLPELDPQSLVMKHFLCYDPIGCVYKVLCLTVPRLILQETKPVDVEHVLQVLTLGNGNNSWKVIEDPYDHFPIFSHICINGVLYYEATTDSKEASVMSFDVRSEKFDLFKAPGDADGVLGCLSTMTRYQGKLAILSTEISANGSMVLWVLEDSLKHEWSKKVFVLPSSWTSHLAHCPLDLHRFVNVTDAGEFILAPMPLLISPYYVLYYDPKKNTVRKVVVEGFQGHRRKLLGGNKGKYCFLFHLFSTEVESLMFM